MAVSLNSKKAKVPVLVKQLQSICDQLANSKLLFEDLKNNVEAMEIGSFGSTYDAEIQAVTGLKHADGVMVDWAIGEFTTLFATFNVPAVNQLRSGQS
jgi:hypothetical protein